MKILFIFFIMQSNFKGYLLSSSHPYIQICQKSKDLELKLLEKEKELIEKEKEITQKDIEIEKLKKEIEDLKKELKEAKDKQITYYLYGILTGISGLFLIITIIIGSQ